MKVATRTDAPSLAATYTSAAFGLEHMDGYSIQIVWTGTPTGDFKLQASNNAFMDNTGLQENPSATWEDISGTTVAAGGAVGNHMYNASAAYYKAVRYVYTRSSSTGAATVELFAKGSI